jgi:hypothetical protein
MQAMRYFAISILFGMVGHSLAQSPPSVDQNVALQVSVANGQHEFHVGEIIPLKLAYSSAAKDRYQINMAQYDRSGRMEYEHFDLSPADGAVDPLEGRLGGIGGGLTGFSFLTPEPWSIVLNLNEWARFTRSGIYRLNVVSKRVGVKDPSTQLGASPIAVQSNEVTLRIVPATKAWQKMTLSTAVAILDKQPASKPQDQEADGTERRKALETLRFLGTADAARELAKRLRGEAPGGLDYVCMLGLISSPEREAVKGALEHELADPDHPISDTFMSALRRVNEAPIDQDWREEQRKEAEQLIAALPAKRGKAMTVSLSTALNEAWNSGEVPKQTIDRLVEQIVSMFDQLPPDSQALLLTYRWDKIAGPKLGPILRRVAEAYRDYPEMRETNAYQSLQLSGSALQHWYELDPAGATPAIIREITRPRPRFNANVLGILPDKTLPEADFPLSENLTASSDYEGLANLASLIARYASDAILPQVTAKLDPLLGKRACAIQDPLLAYVLRVDPIGARVRIEDAVAARGKDFTACNHSLFQGISEIHFDPVLEEIGIHSLDDPDPQVAETAATMLGRYGSSGAEPALLRRFKEWGAMWAGRESELNLTFAEQTGDRVYQLGLGQNLAQALATGKAWLLDERTLKDLAQVTSVKQVRDQLDGYLTIWRSRPLAISVGDNPPAGLDLRVAQYEFHSVEDLEEKLSQFQSGTEFILEKPPVESSASGRLLTEVRKFLNSHGLIITGEKIAD